MEQQNTVPFRNSIRARLLLLVIVITTLAVVITAYVSFNAITQASSNATAVGDRLLRSQAQDFLVHLTNDNALENDLRLGAILKDTENAATYTAQVFSSPDAFVPGQYWLADDNMFVVPDGQYINSEDDLATIYVPNFVPVDENLNRVIEQSAYLDFLFPTIYENNPNTVAIYLIHKDEISRLYPNINLGMILPPDFQATQDMFFVAGTPENNPAKETVWTGIYDDPAGQGLLVTAVSPVYTTNDEFIGIVGIDVSLADLAASIEGSTPVADGYAILINEDGRAIALPPQAQIDILGIPDDQTTPSGAGLDVSNVTNEFAPVLDAMMNKNNGFQSVTINGQELFVAYTSLSSTGWGLANITPADSILQIVTDLQQELESSTRSLVTATLLPVSVGILVLAIVAALFLTNRLLAPINVLVLAAQSVGTGNWDRLNNIGLKEREDELGVLSDAFQKMAAHIRDLLNSLEERVTNRTREMTLAADVGRSVSQLTDLDQLLTEAAEQINKTFDLYHTQIYIVDEATQKLHLRASTGYAGEELLARQHQLPLDNKSINGRSAIERRPIIVTDTQADPSFQPNPLLPRTRSETAVPLIVADTVVGVLDMQSEQPHAFSEETLPALETMAGQLAAAINNATLFNAQARLANELQESAQFLDSVIESLPLMLLVKEAQELRSIRWNAAGEETLGIPRAEILGKTDYEIYSHRERADQSIRADRAVLASRKPLEIPEEAIETRNKGTRLLHTRKIPILGADNEPKYLLSISEDITEQKAIEQTLLDEQERSRTILESVTVPLFITRLSDGKVLYANQILADTFQVPLYTLLKHNSTEFYNDVADQQAFIQTVQGQGLVNNYEVRLRRSNDELFWGLLSARLLNYESDQAVIVTIVDVTETKKTQEAITQTLAVVETQAGRLTRLNELNAFFNEATTVAEVYKFTKQVILDILPGDLAFILLFDADSYTLTPVPLSDNMPPSLETAISMTSTAAALVMRQNKIFRLPDEMPLSNYSDTTPLHEQGIESVIIMPLIASTGAIGTLNIASTKMGTYRHEDTTFLQQVANLIATTIHSKQLGQRTEMLSAIVENHPDFISVGTLDGEVLYLNPSGIEMLALPSQKEVKSLRINDFYPPEEAAQLWQEGIPMALEQGVWQSESWLKRTDGDVIPIEETVSINRDVTGNPVSFSVTMRDIVERKQTEKAQQELNQELADQLAQIRRLQGSLTQENWQQFLTSQNRHVLGFAFEHNAIRPVLNPARRTETAVDNAMLRQEFSDDATMDLPITIRNTTIATLRVRNESGEPLSEEEQTLLVDISRQMAETLERARLFEETELSRNRTDMLYQFGRTLLTAETMPDLRQIIVDNAARAVQADRTMLVLCDLEAEKITGTAAGGENRDLIGLDFNFADINGGLSGWVIREREAALSLKNKPDAREEKAIQDYRAEQELGSILVVPLIYQERILGTLTAINQMDQPDFTQADVDLLNALATQAAVAIENQRLFGQTQARAQREQLLREITNRVNAAIDAESVLRVAAKEIGETLGLQTFVYLTGAEKESNGRSQHDAQTAEAEDTQEVEGKTA